jgi:Protein of unknown function (DUF3300)
MKTLANLFRQSCALVTSGALVYSGMPAMAQDQPPSAVQQPAAQQAPQAERLGRGQLEKLLAPIALYPDDLVAQILTASTYPLEVVQAARWLNEHSNVQGDALQDAMQQQPWDASVKGLMAVPQVLAMMNDKLDWTQQVGEAFLAQPDDVSNAMQQLRAKAAANGNLKSSKQLKVSKVAASGPPTPAPPPPQDVDPAMLPPPPADYIMIEPVDPGMYYVPIYDPLVVYGPWPWPAYSPFYWYPPGYVLGAAAIGFGVGSFVGAALWSHYNWGGGGVSINVARYNEFNHTNLAATAGGLSHWQFNAAHRGTVGFQNAKLREQFGTTATHGTLSTAPHGTFQGTLQGNHALSVNRGGTGPLNTNIKTNMNANGKANTNQNANTHRNANINRSLNTNRNVMSVNPTTHVHQNNPSMNVNRSMNISHGTSFSRNVGRPPPPAAKPHH